MRVSMHGATTKQRKFAKYLATLGISDAACYVKAGYSPEGSDVGACRLKKNPKVKRLIEKYKADDDHKVVASRHERMDALTEMLREGSTEAIRIKAIEVLNKMRGDEITRTVITGANNGPVQIEASRKRISFGEILAGLSEEEGKKLIERFVNNPPALIGIKNGT